MATNISPQIVIFTRFYASSNERAFATLSIIARNGGFVSETHPTNVSSNDARVPPSSRNRARRGLAVNFSSSVAAAVFGLTLTLGLWYAVADRENNLAEIEFRARATGHALLIEDGIKEHVGKVDAVQALFDSDDAVKRNEFQAFAQSILRDQRAILAVSWIPHVTRDQRAAHELLGVSEGLPGYHIKSATTDGALVPAGDKPEYFPVFYTSREPLASDLYGLDVFDGGLKQHTLERARDTSRTAVSGNFMLRSGEGDRNGFFVVMPVYRGGSVPDSLQSRQDDLIGFVQGVFQTGVLIESVLGTKSAPGGLDLYFYAAGPRGAEEPIYFHPSRARTAPVTPQPRAALDMVPHWSAAISVGDREWTMLAAGVPGGPGTPDHLGSHLVLAAGLLVTALLAAYLWSLGRHARRIQAANARLDEQNVRFETALNNMSQGLLLFDATSHLLMHNRRYAEMYRLPPEGIHTGCSLLELLELRRKIGALAEDEPETYCDNLVGTIKDGRRFERLTHLPDGRTIAVTNHPIAVGGWVSTHEDVTDRLHAEAKISYMAQHDALTDLPNRVLFHDHLNDALTHGRGAQLAVLCLDIDHFKSVNDALGHPIGDMLLQAVAGRLRRCIREADTVARLGGDEFAVVQLGAAQPTASTTLATRLIEAITEPYDLNGHHVVVGMSVGVAIAPTDGTDAHQLLKNADMALYRAKEDGRGVFRFFEAEMDSQMQARRALELDLRKAVAEGEFELYYQPLVELRSGRVSGFEALIRWNHAERGMVSPVDFIPLAEETGLIVPIGEWVLHEACKEATNWPDDVSVAINLSPVQFKSKNLLPSVRSALSAAGLPPTRLQIEITESLLLQESEVTLRLLHALRSLGIRISMDDFGTGYSSLGYLQKFPFDKIKIDRSFVHNMTEREDSLAIVRAVTAMGTSLGMTTTAEGVETLAQLDRLRAEGCTEVQGYLFSPPRPASEVKSLLREINPKLRAIA